VSMDPRLALKAWIRESPEMRGSCCAYWPAGLLSHQQQPSTTDSSRSVTGSVAKQRCAGAAGRHPRRVAHWGDARA